MVWFGLVCWCQGWVKLQFQICKRITLFSPLLISRLFPCQLPNFGAPNEGRGNLEACRVNSKPHVKDILYIPFIHTYVHHIYKTNQDLLLLEKWISNPNLILLFWFWEQLNSKPFPLFPNRHYFGLIMIRYHKKLIGYIERIALFGLIGCNFSEYVW